MAIGRLVSLLGLTPPSAAQHHADEPLHDKAVNAAQTGADRHGSQDDGRSDMSAHIVAVLGAIRQLHENAAGDGAGMAVSKAGESLLGSIGALGHLLTAAHDTGQGLPPRVITDTIAVMDQVDADLARLGSGIQERLDRLPAADRDRFREAASRFLAEMRSAVTNVRAAVGG